MSTEKKRPGWLTGLAIMLALISFNSLLIIAILLGLLWGPVESMEPGEKEKEIAILVILGIVSFAVSRGIFKARNWSRQLLVYGGWIFITSRFLIQGDTNAAGVELLNGVLAMSLLTWGLYKTKGAIQYYESSA